MRGRPRYRFAFPFATWAGLKFIAVGLEVESVRQSPAKTIAPALGVRAEREEILFNGFPSKRTNVALLAKRGYGTRNPISPAAQPSQAVAAGFNGGMRITKEAKLLRGDIFSDSFRRTDNAQKYVAALQLYLS